MVLRNDVRDADAPAGPQDPGSVRTLALSVDRLITQFEITTSTDSAGSGTSSMIPLRKTAFGIPASPAFLRASASISSVMSSP